MTSLQEIYERLAPAHRAALQWFHENKDREVSWPKPLDDGTFIVNKAKGIHKPAGIAYAVSVRQSLNGTYADHEPEVNADGAWVYRYFQEQLDPSKRDSQFTNRALVACMEDGVPVGVLRQTKGKPNPRYKVLGLAFVTEWREGYFVLNEVRDDLAATAVSPLEQLETAVESAAQFTRATFEDERRWIEASIVLREGQGAFRDSILAAYDHRCAISDCNVVPVLEAAHIHRYFGVKTNLVSNGLLLRADLHTLYDRALIAIEPSNFELLVSPKLYGTAYGDLKGQKIRLPSKINERPGHDVLLEHKRWVLSRWDAESGQ
ncbi:hypothetical protein AWB78_03136 [Caballeronia calidae]|uniref:HNH nuclease domain-containing protein n=1 Tax=Caballeronia calidae TaxID=1777139 RepID=A0A158BUY2_9BURK|nr:HNH endonuclease [Caballeronia calidae]SAK73893.1 hypothetical protein AWB78_03136 [Caballeronia calidae]